MLNQVRAKRHFINRVALAVGVTLVHVGFQINLLTNENLNIYLLFYGLMFGCLFVASDGGIPIAIKLVCYALIAATTLIGTPLKGFGLSVGLALGYLAVTRYGQDYCRAMTCLLYINLIVVIIQFLGISEWAYAFANYTSQGLPIYFTDEKFGETSFLPQYRPSGIFPSPTYISAFAVLLFSTVLVRNQTSGKSTNFCAGVFMSLLGSTVGLVLALISIFLIMRRSSIKYLLAGFLLSSFLYAYYLPQQFDYNLNINEMRASVTSRLDPCVAVGESVMQNNLPNFFILVFASLVFFLTSIRFGNLTLLVPPMSVLGLPIMVHDITFSLYYFFMLGSVVACTICDAKLLAIVRSPKYQKANACFSSK
jgi:hypothetical protein